MMKRRIRFPRSRRFAGSIAANFLALEDRSIERSLRQLSVLPKSYKCLRPTADHVVPVLSQCQFMLVWNCDCHDQSLNSCKLGASSMASANAGVAWTRAPSNHSSERRNGRQAKFPETYCSVAQVCLLLAQHWKTAN
jgi:hypothetical protein